MNDSKRYRLLFLVVLIGVMFEREAKAYTDPGSGILLWQVLASGFVAGLFYLRRAVRWARRRIGRES